MAVNIYGLNEVTRSPGATLTENEAGTTVFNERLSGRKSDIENFYFSLTRRVSTNPDFPGLSLESKTRVFGEGGIHFLDLVWAGTGVTDGDGPDEVLPEPVWALKRSPSEEPIETHPDFSTFGQAAFGAKFDENGLFLGFSNTGAFEDNEFGGIEKFLDGGAVVQKTSVYRKVPGSILTEVIPKREDPPDPPWPLPSGSGRTWMKTDLNIVQRGAAFEVTEEWTLSGQRGWNETIYP